MFKSASIFKINFGGPASLPALQAGAEKLRFTSCGPTQEKSMGWFPPRGQDHGALIESVGGQYLLKLMIETRSVPASALAEEVEKRRADIELRTGRKPGKKEIRNLKDEVRLAMLPMAFTAKHTVSVWIDPVNFFVVIDSAVTTRTDEVLKQIIHMESKIEVAVLNTVLSPSTLMSNLLLGVDVQNDTDRFGFEIGKSCELKASDESKAKVSYTNHDLLCDEVVDHLKNGKTAIKLALTFKDRVSFVLTETGVIASIKFLEIVFENSKDAQDDSFDADAALFTGEMSDLIPCLIDSLGGRIQLET